MEGLGADMSLSNTIKNTIIPEKATKLTSMREGFISIFSSTNKQTVETFGVFIKLDNKETAERLNKLVWRFKCPITPSLGILYNTDQGILLKQGLEGIKREIMLSTKMLGQHNVPAQRFLAEQVLALENLCPQVKQHLGDVGGSDSEQALSQECQVKTRDLQILLHERVKGLREMQGMFAALIVKMGQPVWAWPECRCVKKFARWVMGEPSEKEKRRIEEEKLKLLNAKIVKFRPFY